MSKRKTRMQKKQAEIRKLKAEKDELNRTKAILEEELQQLKGAEKVKEISVWMAAFWYIYDIVISALILVFVYWISIEGIEKFDVPYGCLVMMVLMISLKCAFRKWECRFDIVMQVLINDLLKPFITMFLGMIIFMKSLGDNWKNVKGFAFDTAHTGVLVLCVVIVVSIIFLFANTLIFVIKTVKKK